MRRRVVNDSLEIVIDNSDSFYYEFKTNKKIEVVLTVLKSIKPIINLEFLGSDVDLKLVVEDSSDAVINILNEDHNTTNFNIDISKSNLNINNLVIGKELNTNYNVSINEETAVFKFVNSVYLDNEFVANFDIKVNHNASNTKANILNNIVLNNESTSKMNIENNVPVLKGNIETYQKTKVLALSDDVKIHVNPILNIDYYDIKGGHAVSFLNINDYNLDYIMSRGISFDDAKKLVAKGFLLENIEDKEEKIESRI